MPLKKNHAIVIALTALALVLRVPGLDAPLWYDEILSLVESFRPPLAHIVTTYPDSNHHTLLAVLSHMSVSAFGEHAWVIRLPAMLFGVAGIPALYLLGTVVANRREATLASLLLATSYHDIWFSQNARGYTALLFFMLVATWALLKGLTEQRGKWFVVYGVAAALGVYTHLTLLFAVAGHALSVGWIVLRTPDRDRWAVWRLPLMGFAVAGVVTLTLYMPMMASLYAFVTHAAYPTAQVATPAVSARHALDSLRLGMHTVGFLIGGVLGLVGTISYLKRQPAALALFVVPGLTIAAGAFVIGTPLRPRFLFLLIGFAMLLIVRGAVNLVEWAMELRVSRDNRPEYVAAGTVAVVLLMVGVAVPSILYNYRFPKQDFASARMYVAAHRSVDEPVITAGTAVYPFTRYYQEHWEGVTTAAEFDVVRRRYPRLWIVYSQPEYLEVSLRHAIEHSCAMRKVFHGTLGGGDVVVCDTSGEQRAAYGKGAR